MLEQSVGRGGGSCLKPELPLQVALQAILYISRLQEPLAYLSLTRAEFTPVLPHSAPQLLQGRWVAGNLRNGLESFSRLTGRENCVPSSVSGLHVLC